MNKADHRKQKQIRIHIIKSIQVFRFVINRNGERKREREEKKKRKANSNRLWLKRLAKRCKVKRSEAKENKTELN